MTRMRAFVRSLLRGPFMRRVAVGLSLIVMALGGCGEERRTCAPCCPPLEVMEAVAYIGPGYDVDLLRDPALVPTVEQVMSCLELRKDRRRAYAAWYLLTRNLPIDPALVNEMLRSSEPAEREFGLAYLLRRSWDPDAFWKAIEVEQDPVIVEVSLEGLTLSGRYTGDVRLIKALRRVIGVRDGRPMKAVAVLNGLIPSADVDVHFNPELLVEEWKRWLDRHGDTLKWDEARGVFTYK